MTTTTTENATQPALLSTPMIGDVLVSSWGYEQTNVTWYQVVAVTKASVKIVKIAEKIVEFGKGSDRVEPELDADLKGVVIGPIVTKRVRATDRGYAVTISSYADAYLWDGSAQYQTAAGYGH